VSPRAPRNRNRPQPPAHRPAKYRHHVADEYEALGNVHVAAELRRHLRGHYAAWQRLALGTKAATEGTNV